MIILWHLVVFVCVIIAIPRVSTSHFKGGVIFWSPTGNGQEISVTVRSAWISSSQCDGLKISSGTTLGITSLSCFEGCSGSAPFVSYCSDYCSTDNWSQAEGHVIYTFSSSIMKIGYESGDWVHFAEEYRNGWRLVTTVNTNIRTDTGKINSSPRASILQVTQAIIGCPKNITIPVTDSDGDTIRCRWAEADKNECAGACGHNNFTLNQNSCVLSISATNSTVTGFYPIALQVEDFVSSTSTTPLSSIPLQFLIRVNATNDFCNDLPIITEPSSTEDPFATIAFDTSFATTVVARTSSSMKTITEIAIVSPLGMTKSALATYGGTGREWSITVSWTPTNNQNGSNYLCVAAYDSNW